ncbi:hypothetical protein [Nitrosomonas sp. Is37]|uniref:hypothetical protein n=1 Tax=Nitrosomonas sp. Is37 TaxID=3080535 RepID=UPI00294ADEAB|nr:hypothetical protein [Nitrosomonas sp. Is37]MDV6345636.1 hypothetical protein [Nitrosomonas sp. Is37]
MKIKDLAEGLGISVRMVYKLKQRGMPTDSLEAAIEWRRRNLDVTQTKRWRIDGNSGVKCEKANSADHILSGVDDEQLNRVIKHVLTEVMPVRWFQEMGWLATALRECGVNITAEQVVRTQQPLFLIYIEEVTRFLQENDDLEFEVTPILKAQPDDEIYPSMIRRLNQILSEEMPG